ncbi:putative chromatin-associated swi6 [Fusarium longipes]|uniref:Putative chromatin-associated swi6 n=1 Tax=Fusarium longipes TaxID=694270 RepID=A0A395SF44_9HYPO|nr:putative chromatin-associated swi6 [Fusarium longipes]
MPPALSDEENSDVEEFTTPPRTSRRKSTSAVVSEKFEDIKPEYGSDEHGEGEDDEDLDEDEFVVEAIRKHFVDEDGTLKFQVKWEGYDAKKDLTWEPEENLRESAQEILDQYFEKLGGREKIFEETETAAKTKKRRRATNGTPSTAASTTTKRSRREKHPADTTPPTTSKPWSPPAGSWEDEIESIELEQDDVMGKIIVYLRWKNGKKTKHDTEVIYRKCPQKMLRFYERHLKIDRGDSKEFVE